MHTPAPWMRRGCTIHTPDNRIIATACINVGVPADEENAKLIALAPQMAEALRAAACPCWVHNAGITNDIEALRRIALWHADWNNSYRVPLVPQLPQ